jgi:glycosyltransferase involved in cell wall biosynthesis
VTVITLTKVVTYSLDERVRHIALSTRNEDSIWSLVLLYPYYRVRLLLHFFNNTYDGGMSLLEPANILHILTKKHAVVSFRTSFAHFKGVFGRIYLFFVLKFYKYARKIIVNSEENKWRMSKKGGYVTGKVKVLYNMLDIESIYKLKQEPLPNTIAKKIHNKKVFITVGRLVAAKRHYDILA